MVLADPAAEPDFDGLRCTVTERPGSNRFRWSHPVGTMSGYEVQLEDVSSGLSQRHQVAAWATRPTSTTRSTRMRPTPGRLCSGGLTALDLPAAAFVDGDLYRWRIVAAGFLSQEESDWKFLRPQV